MSNLRDYFPATAEPQGPRKTPFWQDPHILGGLLVVASAIILRHCPEAARALVSADFQDILTGLALVGIISARNADGKVSLTGKEQ